MELKKYDDRKGLKFLEARKIVDKILPSKSEVDYTKLIAGDLIEKFEQVMTDAGYDTYYTYLHDNVRYIIEYYQNIIYNLSGNINGAEYGKEREPGFDQNNYFIQDMLSQLKTSLLHAFIYPEQYYMLVKNDRAHFLTRVFGTMEEIESMLNEEEIRKYVESSINVTWADGTIVENMNFVAKDIAMHFGFTDDSDICDKIKLFIYNLYDDATQTHGLNNSEGSSMTSLRLLDQVVDAITKYIYASLAKVIENTKEYEKRQNQSLSEIAIGNLEKASVIESEPKVTIVEQIESTETKEEPSPEDIINKYEALARIIERNKNIELELAKLATQRKELEEELANNKSEMKSKFGM